MYFCICYTELHYAEFIHITIYILLGDSANAYNKPCRSG